MRACRALLYQNTIAIARAHEPTSISSSDITGAIGNANSLRDALLIHEHIIRHGLESEGGECSRRSSLSSSPFEISILQMYSDYGASREALSCFHRMLSHDAIGWTYIIKAHVYSKEWALRHFNQMHTEGVFLNKFLSIAILSSFSNKEALEDAKHIHTHIYASGLEKDTFVATSLLSMYSKCSSITNALSTFEKLVNRDVVAWNAMLSAYVEAGWHRNALEHFEEMQRFANVTPSKVTFLSILEACGCLASLEEGKYIHGLVLARKIHEDISVANAMINMYSKCGSVYDAKLVFDQMLHHDTISWNTMLAAYVQAGQQDDALLLFERMQSERISMDKVTFVTLLVACTNQNTFPLAKELHHNVVCCGFDLDAVVGTVLIITYSKSGGRVNEARNVFNIMKQHDVIAWNAMISTYGQHGLSNDALRVFELMILDHVPPDKATFVSLLDACASDDNIGGGEWIHNLIRESDFEKDLMVGTAMVRTYASYSNLEDAEKIFDNLLDKDIVLWNTMISGYITCGENYRALSLYNQMMEEGVIPNRITFSSLLNVCANECALAKGKEMHALFATSVIETDIIVVSALVNMYGKCGCVKYACYFFDQMQECDLVVWTTMISVYAQHGQPQKAFALFQQMQQEGLIPDIVTIIGIVCACSTSDMLYIGKKVHACILDSLYSSDTVLGNALVNMYGKCGCFDHALFSFKRIRKRDTISFLNIISACANHAALIQGQQVHNLLIVSGLDCDEVVRNSLVNLYGKCGALVDARKSFEDITERHIVAWNAMMVTYSLNGNGEDALLLLKQMWENKLKPDSFTFVSVLTACNHAGLIEEGYSTFLSISEKCESSPILDHYNCLLDMLARAGQLDEAESLIKVMPLRATTVSWTSLLGACKTDVDVGRGERVATNALNLDPRDASLHVLLSNIYCVADCMDAVEQIVHLQSTNPKQPNMHHALSS